MTDAGDRERPLKKGVDAAVDLEQHQGNNVDPTGHVSSGLQPGPLHGGDERPVASTDEAMRRERVAGSPGRERDPPEPHDLVEPYLAERRAGDDADS